jgi:[protein-PII] uridylyltransferase
LRTGRWPVDLRLASLAELRRRAQDGLTEALTVLDARPVAGSVHLAELLRDAALRDWRRDAASRLTQLRDAAELRGRRHGELAYRAEPDLKESRGGLRDVAALHAAAATQLLAGPGERVQQAHRLLLDTRGTLHALRQSAGRPGPDSALTAAEAPAVARLLGYRDAGELTREVSGAGRAVARALDRCWRRGPVPATPPVGERATGSSVLANPRRSRGGPPPRRPLAEGVVEQSGEVVLARGASPGTDPGLVLRAAAAAAGRRLALSQHTLAVFGAAPTPPPPWPEETRGELVRLLGAGPALPAAVEDLDASGYWSRLLPEWDQVRYRRSPGQELTDDRRLLDTTVAAAGLVRRTGRPDLLLLAALLHAIAPDPVASAAVAGRVAERIGLGPADTGLMTRVVRHGGLLADTAVRRDVDDPSTATAVIERLGGAPGASTALDVLYPLTVAVGLAAGPTAWSGWQAELVARLMAVLAARLGGPPPPVIPAASARGRRVLARLGREAVPVLESDPEAGTVTVAAVDRVGLLATCAGVLALHGLDVRSVTGGPQAGAAVLEFRVRTRLGTPVDEALLAGELRNSLAGTFPLTERLAARAATAPAGAPAGAQPGSAAVVAGASLTSTVLEIRAPDRLGLLHELAAVIASRHILVRSVFCSTIGHEALDVFYLPQLATAALTGLLEALRPVLDAGGPVG